MKLLCRSCQRIYNLVPSDDPVKDESYLKVILAEMWCPVCERGLAALLDAGQQNHVSTDFTPEQFVQMDKGLSKEDIEEIIQDQRIIDAKLIELPQKRVGIQEIRLSSGYTLHLAVGHGVPVVYKITKIKVRSGKCQDE